MQGLRQGSDVRFGVGVRAGFELESEDGIGQQGSWTGRQRGRS